MSSRATSRSHRRQKSSSGTRNTKGSVPEPVEPNSTTPPSSPPQETYMLAATLRAAMADEQQSNDSDSNSNGTRKDQSRGNDRNRQPSQRHQDSDQSTGNRRHRTSSRNREERGRSREDRHRRTPSQSREERDRSKEDRNRRTPSQTREEKGRSSEDRSRHTPSQQRREKEKDRPTEDREDRHHRIPSQSRQQRQQQQQQQRQRREPSIERQQQQQQQQQPAQQQQPQFQFSVDEPDGRDSRPTELGSLQDFGSPDVSESYTATMPLEMEQEQPISWGRRFRVRVMMMATVPRLQANWIVLALTSAMAWLALIPAYVFWGKTLGAAYYNPSYSFFLGATVSTTLTAIWQSFCPLIVQMSQTALLPRVINHPITQTVVLVISIILTVLNFLSWIILASDGAGAKTNCQTGVFSDLDGYALQCRGVNTAIVINAFVFLFWMPIALIIVCGIMERGLWWWDDSWGQEVEMAVTESNPELVSEFDRKSVAARSMILYTPRPGELIPPPSPAFVTPVAIHRRLAGTGSSRRRDIESGNAGFTTPAQYRQSTRQQQQQQLQPQLQVPGASSSLSVSSSQSQMRDQKGSTTSLVPSLSQRFSSFFGQGWGNGAMPPPNDSEPSPPQRQQNRGEPSRLRESHRRTPSDASRRRQESDKASYHGDGYLTQWHNRRNDEWS